MPHTILVVDDEPDLLAVLDYALGREGFVVRTAADGRSALAAAQIDPIPHLILLDLMLPDMSGTEVFRRLRRSPATANIPVVMVTAKGEEIDRVVGLELGADDYVVKPFSTRELVLRIRVLLKRMTQRPPSADLAPRLRFGELEIDPAGHRCFVSGEEVVLTALEFKLLEVLHQGRGRVFSRDKLVDLVWGQESDVVARTVDTHVKRLRQKLGPAKGYVETIRGVGYRFTERI